MKQAFAILAAGVLAALPTPLSAQAASFTLVNNTNIPFASLMVRPFGSQQWRPLVVVPMPVAASGGRGSVDFSDQDCAFDLQATLPDGRAVVWRDVNLCEARVVSLNRTADGQLWVDYR